MNGVTIDCSLDIAVHPADSAIVLLTVPGVDGSVDGYQEKYITIAERILEQHGIAVVRIANPFITSHHWESNIRHALSYVTERAEQIAGHADVEIRIMAHSAGAAVIAQIAWEYPQISRLLLINPATSLGLEKMKRGIAEFHGDEITILYGSKDPSVKDAKHLAGAIGSGRAEVVVLEDVDHNFSGDALKQFIEAPGLYLFN